MVGAAFPATFVGMGTAAHPGARFWAGSAGQVLRRPGLWPTAFRQAHRLARPGWWRRPPFLPVPDRDYLRFRLETQYGAGGTPVAADLVTYLQWCHANRARRPAA
jgi:hypothetical protein